MDARRFPRAPMPSRLRFLAALTLLTAGPGCDSRGGPADESAARAPVCAAAPAPAPLRRLTRFEYGRSIADLTGADPGLALALPPDEESLGFLNNADAYSVSSLHATKYLELAEKIAEGFVADGARLAEVAGCDPLAGGECVAAFVDAFGLRAWRRPLAGPERAAMLELYAAEADPSPGEGLSAVVAAMLQAPQFLYRPEPADPAASDLGALDPYVLATRLSYLLVGSTPDAPLLSAAADGRLSTPAGLETETERLLADPRALEAFSHFIGQWWELGTLPALEKDRLLYRDWTDEMPAALGEELRLFVSDLWQGTPTLEALLSAPYTFIDHRLATLYGLPAPATPGFHKVELDPTRASGILTQGALLATHAKANQTSPVHRGKFVRSRLFCAPPPPPPPDIVVRPPTVDPRLSTRERFAAHTADDACAHCHALMDPIGFAFEHFDAVGRYRDVDGGKPVDARGELVGTDVDGEFEGIPALARRLLESDQVRHCVATQWFRFAFGRGQQTPLDACTVERLADELEHRGGDLRAMIRATVKEALFGAAPEVEP
jgi:hypothetical protein